MLASIWKTVRIRRNFFLFSYALIFVGAVFFMNFISLPALLLDREIILAPRLSIWNILFLFIFTLLASVAVTLQKNQRETSPKSVGFFGGIFALGASACPFCQSLVFTTLAVAGLPVSLQALPLHGEEFKLASLLFLGAAVYLTARGCTDCRI